MAIDVRNTKNAAYEELSAHVGHEIVIEVLK